jgi:hypothetical protein
MAPERPIERGSGRLSPLIEAEALGEDDSMWESLDGAAPKTQNKTPEVSSTPSIITHKSKKGKKHKLGARSGSEAPDGPESSRPNQTSTSIICSKLFPPLSPL